MLDPSILDERFTDFHRLNPHVYTELVKLARKAKKAGKRTIGIRMIWETTRWNLWLRTKGDADYKLNNNLHSRYARLIMAQESDLVGIFNTRSRR